MKYASHERTGIAGFHSYEVPVVVTVQSLILSDSLQPHELPHTKIPCPSPSPEVCSNSCLLSRWYHPTISSSVSPSPSALNLSQHQDLSNETALHIKWPKHWCFNISPSNEYQRLIFFRIDWFDLLAVQGILKSLFQHHSSKASILWCSGVFMVQLSHSYMTTRKTIALAIRTFVRKVMSLLFYILSGFIIAFLPRSKRLLISWLQSPSAVILEPKKIKSVILMGPDAMIFIF